MTFDGDIFFIIKILICLFDLADNEISQIKEIYREDGEKIVEDLRKDVFKTSRRISKRFSRDAMKIQKELKITD